MGVVTALLIAGAAVAAAGAAGGAYAKKKAADKGAEIQQKALVGQKKILKDELSFERINQAATDADRLRAENRLALQKEIDPELAQLRQLGKEKLLEETQRPNASLQSTQVANALFNENAKEDPRLEALKSSIINRAQEEIAAGSTLPPQFQAELVRAGVQQGAQAGFATDARTVGGTIAKALGIGGEQLKVARENQAVNLAGAATNLDQSRANILGSIFPTIAAAEQARRQNAAAEFGIGEATLPESGLTGREAAAIQQNRGNTLLKIRGQQGQIKAQQAAAQGEATAAYIGAGASFASSALGAYGGSIGGGTPSFGSQYQGAAGQMYQSVANGQGGGFSQRI